MKQIKQLVYKATTAATHDYRPRGNPELNSLGDSKAPPAGDPAHLPGKQWHHVAPARWVAGMEQGKACSHHQAGVTTAACGRATLGGRVGRQAQPSMTALSRATGEHLNHLIVIKKTYLKQSRAEARCWTRHPWPSHRSSYTPGISPTSRAGAGARQHGLAEHGASTHTKTNMSNSLTPGTSSSGGALGWGASSLVERDHGRAHTGTETNRAARHTTILEDDLSHLATMAPTNL